MNSWEPMDNPGVDGRRQVEADPQRSDDTLDFSLLQLANTLLKHRLLVLGLPALVLTLTTVLILTSPRTYTSTGSFMPLTGDSRVGISGLAAQFGISVPSGSEPSPQFYADLLQSSTILEPLADSTYGGTDGEHQTLARAFDIQEKDYSKAKARVLARLRAIMSVSVNTRTAVIRYSVTTTSPRLSEQIGQRWMAEVDQFNVQTRRGRAAAERRFLEDRAAVTLGDLRRAENRLQEFLQRNRVFQNDPRLVFEHDRLSRDVRISEQVYTTLAQALEQASVESARSTPTLTVVESPKAPAGPNGRRLVMRAAVAVLGGLLAGVFAAVIRESLLSAPSREPKEFAEFLALRRRVATDLRHPLRALRNSSSAEPTARVD
jgi:uncharacterized protein involved in exopolysaccharide biosynthesis